MLTAAHEELDSLPRDPYEAAAYWHELHREDDISDEEKAQFDTWLQANPDHAVAYQAIVASWDGMAEMASDSRIAAMREVALVTCRDKRRYWRNGWAVAAVLLLAVLGGLWHYNPYIFSAKPVERFYQTAVGERSSVDLADGTILKLNTASRANVYYNSEIRRVSLIAGEAMFHVAKDPSRPFVVMVGNRRVTAVGTAFNVRLTEDDEVRVTLLEGIVDVASDMPADKGRSIPDQVRTNRLKPGEQLIAPRSGPVVVRQANLADVTSWLAGRLVFEDDRLADAIAEVNRYSQITLVLADADLADLPVSGVFDVGRPTNFVDVITQFYDLSARKEPGDQIRLSRRK